MVSPDEATESVRNLRTQVVDAHAVGDLTALVGRLDALRPGDLASSGRPGAPSAPRRPRPRRPRRSGWSPRPRSSARATTGATARTGCGSCSTSGRRCPGIDRAADDALWRRFSTARTSYTRRRKAHFAEQNEKRESRPGGQAAAGQGGRGAGRLPRVGPDRRRVPRPDAAVEGRRPGAARRRGRAVDAVPRRAGHVLRGARRGDGRPGLRVRRQRRGQGEAARRGRGAGAGHRRRRPPSAPIRDIAERWDADRQGAARQDPAARGPDARRRAGRSAASRRSSGASRTRRSPPAPTTWSPSSRQAIGKVEADLEKARAAGDEKKVAELEENLASRRAFLEMAQRASADYSG